MESLVKYPRRTSGSSGLQNTPQQPEEQQHPQQSMSQSTRTDPAPSEVTGMQVDPSNSVAGGDNSINIASTSASSSTIIGLLHQNSMNSRQQSSMGNTGSPYGAFSGVQIASPGSSTTTIPQTQPNASPFQSPTPSSSNNPSRSSVDILNSVNSPANASLQQQGISSEADQSENQSSVQKILQEMMSTPLNGSGAMSGMCSLGNESSHVNGIIPGINTGGLNGPNIHNPGLGPSSFSQMGAQPAMVNGFRNSVGNGNPLMNGRVGMGSMVQGQSMNRQSDMNNQILNGLRAVNGFNNLQYDWKPSP
ncbi:hypothetical protein CRG98_029895 [Punica granatum]|nr:hypothetical protein CRG98_029895 [Punica granatum]